MDFDAYQLHKRPRGAQHQFRGWQIISDQVEPGELQVVWQTLDSVLQAGVPGDVVEFGCYAGTTSIFIRRLLDEQAASTTHVFHVYDSFEGLPEKTAPDRSPAGTQFSAGKLSVSKKALLHEFQTAHLRPPVVHKGWFAELSSADVPEHIAFAYLDGDFYQSIFDSLRLVWPRLSPGGMVLIDDYGRDALPGPQRAVHDFFQGSPPLIRREHDIAILKK